MAVAAPSRRSAPAPGPSRTTAPTGPAPARRRPLRPTRKPAARKPAARGAPAKARSMPQRAVAGGQLIPLAVGRTAVAVRQLPDSGLIVRMTRGRAWIAVLGLLLVGIVALNVVTLSFASSAGKIDEEIGTLEQENGVLKGREAELSGTARVRGEAASLGLTMPTADRIHLTQAGPGDIATAAQRLAAAGGG